MKKSVILVLTAVLVLSSCSKPKGFLVGVYSKAKPEQHRMVWSSYQGIF